MKGYDRPHSGWREYLFRKFEEQIIALGPRAGQNLEIFKSPKGTWMAFHAIDPCRLFVRDLETGRIITEVPNVSGSISFSTYVPSFYELNFGFKTGPEKSYTDVACIVKSSFFDSVKTHSLPIAFSAYTYKHDDLYYVESLDLSRIDEGVIDAGQYDTFEIPFDAEHVRNHVRPYMAKNGEGLNVDFFFLEERVNSGSYRGISLSKDLKVVDKPSDS